MRVVEGHRRGDGGLPSNVTGMSSGATTSIATVCSYWVRTRSSFLDLRLRPSSIPLIVFLGPSVELSEDSRGC